jgi:hypothetical protein
VTISGDRQTIRKQLPPLKAGKEHKITWIQNSPTAAYHAKIVAGTAEGEFGFEISRGSGKAGSAPAGKITALSTAEDLVFKHQAIYQASFDVTAYTFEVYDTEGDIIHREDSGNGGQFKANERITLKWDDPSDVFLVKVHFDGEQGQFGDHILAPMAIEIPHTEVVFDSGQALIKGEQSPKLDDAAAVAMHKLDSVEKAKAAVGNMLAGSGYVAKLYISGYTDTVGPTGKNQTLSETARQGDRRLLPEEGRVVRDLLHRHGRARAQGPDRRQRGRGEEPPRRLRDQLPAADRRVVPVARRVEARPPAHASGPTRCPRTPRSGRTYEASQEEHSGGGGSSSSGDSDSDGGGGTRASNSEPGENLGTVSGGGSDDSASYGQPYVGGAEEVPPEVEGDAGRDQEGLQRRRDGRGAAGGADRAARGAPRAPTRAPTVSVTWARGGGRASRRAPVAELFVSQVRCRRWRAACRTSGAGGGEVVVAVEAGAGRGRTGCSGGACSAGFMDAGRGARGWPGGARTTRRRGAGRRGLRSTARRSRRGSTVGVLPGLEVGDEGAPGSRWPRCTCPDSTSIVAEDSRAPIVLMWSRALALAAGCRGRGAAAARRRPSACAEMWTSALAEQVEAVVAVVLADGRDDQIAGLLELGLGLVEALLACGGRWASRVRPRATPGCSSHAALVNESIDMLVEVLGLVEGPLVVLVGLADRHLHVGDVEPVVLELVGLEGGEVELAGLLLAVAPVPYSLTRKAPMPRLAARRARWTSSPERSISASAWRAHVCMASGVMSRRPVTSTSSTAASIATRVWPMRERGEVRLLERGAGVGVAAVRARAGCRGRARSRR